jgi:hypothetical protein
MMIYDDAGVGGWKRVLLVGREVTLVARVRVLVVLWEVGHVSRTALFEWDICGF